MEKLKLIVLIGIPGSGKSTVAKALSKKHDAVIHSSDELRLEMFGSYDVQDRNIELFEELNNRIKTSLLIDGQSVIADMTNLNYKNRRSLLNLVHKTLYIEKIAIVVATTIDTCIKRDSERDRTVGARVINRMVKQFCFPVYGEGFDKIDIIYTEKIDKFKFYLDLSNRAEGFEQDNPHHSLTLQEHMLKASEEFLFSHEDSYSSRIHSALLIHDYGKLYTKSFKNKKGETREYASYLKHENVSAYLAMFADYNHPKKDATVYICQLVQYHMRHYGATTDKAKKRLKNLVGEQLYSDLLIVNKYDRLGH